ncbi:fluoroquinolone transport system permease protein [Bacillus horti]|uniref:Fluoroquinolone transport system permease protein n=2 Tax=Caldalkalibacillus horti TaxID=77523 RepID=A0ABT9VVP8_9BACI|nr:fluoroquinolone transport system permease protein [Bacillus horti]
MRIRSLVTFDVRFQWKQRFYHVYLLVCAVYISLLLLLPEAYVDKTIVLLTFSDPAALGLFFSGGMLLLEREQGIQESLFATPLRVKEYVIARCLSLSVLSLAAAYVIHIAVKGWPVSPIAFTLGVLLSSFFFTLLGMCAAVLSHSINGFLLLSQGFALPFVFPVLGYLNWLPSPLYKLLPTEGSLLLIEGSNQIISLGDAVYAIIVLLLWIGFAGWWSVSLLQRTIKMLDEGKN